MPSRHNDGPASRFTAAGSSSWDTVLPATQPDIRLQIASAKSAAGLVVPSGDLLPIRASTNQGNTGADYPAKCKKGPRWTPTVAHRGNESRHGDNKPGVRPLGKGGDRLPPPARLVITIIVQDRFYCVLSHIRAENNASLQAVRAGKRRVVHVAMFPHAISMKTKLGTGFVRQRTDNWAPPTQDPGRWDREISIARRTDEICRDKC